MEPIFDPFHAASTAAVFLDRSDRVRLAVSGPDRAKFLHNLTTNDVKRLEVGRGVEAFVTSPQGKTIGYVTMLATDDAVLVRTDAGGSALFLPHFQKYGVFDDVTIDDLSADTFEFHVAGPNAEAVVGRVGGPLPEAGDLRHGEATVGAERVRIVRESPTGYPGLTVQGARAAADAVRQAILQAGAAFGVVELDQAAAELLRIEAGVPAFGRDVTADNLPQEVGRDAQAINFVKGCYLGQETVARIDALGHVNKHLRGLLLTGGADEVPPPGSAIEADGKVVGQVTSSAYSPRRGGAVALGYVRTAKAAAGSAVEVVAGETRRKAVVSDLPMQAP